MKFDFILNFIFPNRCLNCLKPLKEGVICQECFNKIEINDALYCGKCHARLPNGKKICHLDQPYILGAASNYDNEIVKNLILALKFKYIKKAALPLSLVMLDYLNKLNLDIKDFIVIPIPLSKKRLRSRGFNQSEILAKIIADKLQLPIDTYSLCREKDTKPQSEILNLKDRISNLENAFKIIKSENIKDKNILLIDDVSTTGSTLFSAASLLKKSGAKKIIALTVAKA